MLVFLGGILRLADALCRLDGRRIYRLQIERSGDVVWISVPGYSENGAAAEKLASAGHLLEVACRLPILFR